MLLKGFPFKGLLTDKLYALRIPTQVNTVYIVNEEAVAGRCSVKSLLADLNKCKVLAAETITTVM